MTVSTIAFQQTGATNGKKSYDVIWFIDREKETIKVEYSQGANRQSKGKIGVESVHFISQNFDKDNRWEILEYKNNGQEYLLVVEGPKSMKGRTVYETRIEKIKEKNVLVDKCYISEMPEFRRQKI